MQEIAQGYVSAFVDVLERAFDLIVKLLGPSTCESRTRVKVKSGSRTANYRVANNLTRSCHVSTLNSWKRKLASGARSIRCAMVWFSDSINFGSL